MFKDKIGIEVECENAKEMLDVMGWRVVGEPMLRGGYEYVFKRPTEYRHCKPLLNTLFNKFTTEEFTQRCSTHLHVDVEDMSRTQLFNFITLYVMFEEVLLQLVCKERRGNLFCLPISDSVAAQNIITDCATTKRDINYIMMNEAKYCAINLASVGEHNSLEFRALQGTKDVDLIMNWINVHLAMKQYAMLDNITPDKLVVMSSELGFVPLFKRVMEGFNVVFEGVQDMENLIKIGVRNAQMFAFMGRWE